jgi:hypothetical protein
MYRTHRDNFSWGWNVECRDGAFVLNVGKRKKDRKKGHKELIESEGKCKENVHVKFSLRFVTHDALNVYEEVEVQLHSFLTMTLE